MSQDVKNILLNTANNTQDTTNRIEKVESSPDFGVNNGFYGDALYDGNINDIITDVIPKLIVMVGFAGYGKSTMIGSLYHHLIVGGTIDDYELIDSDTFVGFERRVALRRLKEGKLNSAVQRTLRGDNYYLSLDLSNAKTKHKIVISDKAGELYNEYKNNKTIAQADTDLQRADSILLLIDSIKLFNDLERSKSKEAILDLVENISINEQTCLNVVFTKIDLIEDKDSFKTISDEMVRSIESVLKRSINRKYFIDSKQVPITPTDDPENSIVGIFNDIIKSYSVKTSKSTDLNWISSVLK